MQNYRELLAYSLISNNFEPNSRILAIGEISESLKNALALKHEIYKLINPEILSAKQL
ncbi:MAG: hypothetical protein IPM96_07985 [Ignavibacteria bacterium]|nr:hypothetical protein [Ignavibacteria bacterium]